MNASEAKRREAARKAHETRLARRAEMEGVSMQGQAFGVEIELKGLSFTRAANAVARALPGGRPVAGRGYHVADRQGRIWKVVHDGSVPGGCEVVSPKLGWTDMADLQAVVRALRLAGGRVDGDCGIHVHVDATNHDHKSLARLAKIVRSKEELLYRALGVSARRAAAYTRPVEAGFIGGIARSPSSMARLNQVWYGTPREQRYVSHYHGSRYHGLNLHAVWDKGTVEFRYFDSTLHAGKVRAYVCLCLALSQRARVSTIALKDVSTARRERSAFRSWLKSLGLGGDEFKAVRKHLLGGLTDGDGRGARDA